MPGVVLYVHPLTPQFLQCRKRLSIRLQNEQKNEQLCNLPKDCDFIFNWGLHSKNCGVKLTPPVLIEDHTMHFTPVLNLRC